MLVALVAALLSATVGGSPTLALAALVGYVNFMNPRATSWSKSPRYHVGVCVPSM